MEQTYLEYAAPSSNARHISDARWQWGRRKNHGAQNQTLSESKLFESWVVPLLTLMHLPYET